MAITEDRVLEALKTVQDPELHQDLVSLGMIDDIVVEGEAVRLTINLTTPACPLKNTIENDVRGALGSALGVRDVAITFGSQVRGPQQEPLPGVKTILAVGSGKGGVGKSTVAANLAASLALEGASVGLLDADIYGPSQPRMMGLKGRPKSTDGKRIQPLDAYGLKVMSAGFLVDPDTPMIWRGPMVTQALTQLLSGTDWGELDYLVVDMPPGTGDIQLTLAQNVPVAGAVIVTTPQEIAVADARKGVAMFEKVEVPVLGIIENMAGFRCAHCGEVTDIFGAGGGASLAEEKGVALLGRIPLDPRIQGAADGGRPSVAADPEGDNASDYRAAALKTAAVLAQRSLTGSGGPEIIME